MCLLLVAPARGREIYENLKKFQLSGHSAPASNLILKRDRVTMTFDGTFYFEAPVAGEIRGAVFLGRGAFSAEPPPGPFERSHVRRMLGAETVESDFRTAVLRFADDTFQHIGKNLVPAAAVPTDASALAASLDRQILKETGANVAARLAISLWNREAPGFFLAQFDKGKRGRFTFLLDHQGRVPVATFSINAGEVGLIFAHRDLPLGNDIWTAFHSLEAYQKRRSVFSDAYDLVAIPNYVMQVDVRDPKKALKLQLRLDCVSTVDGLRAIPLSVGESLPETGSVRLKKTMRAKSARLANGASIDVIQEDWEGGLTLLLPSPLRKGETFTVEAQLEGDFIRDSPYSQNVYYPLLNGEWYPRHGYLNRSKFDLTFLHRRRHRVASVGMRIREEASKSGDSDALTQWRMDTPVALVTFGLGGLESHTEVEKRKEGDLPVEFFSLPGQIMPIKEDFILAELMNSVRYFSHIFGAYPYPRFGATYHPRSFGQGFASMLLIPPTDSANKYTYSFIAHETAHQWWGNIVAWRSYRDQWLSEGFAEYSGVLYTSLREKRNGEKELIQALRRSLLEPLRTEVGIRQGRLADVGPLIFGHRVETRETHGAYQALIYNKGALVLRMLHFLFTHPEKADSTAFFEMLQDFVRRHQNGWASTEDFMAVANEHFVRTPLAQKYQMKDLNWFFQQWVYNAQLPSYRLEYAYETQPGNSVVLNGTVYQEGVPEDWFMFLPVVARSGRDGVARFVVHVHGPKAMLRIRLPRKPDEIQLDPDEWVLSEKTSTRALR